MRSTGKTSPAIYRYSTALIILVISVVLLLPSAAFADILYWSKKADMPTARWRAASGVVNGKIYVIGGTTGASYMPSGVTDVVEAYDPGTNTWQTMPSLTTGPRFAAGSAVQGNYIYIVGGGSTDAPPVIEDTVVRYNTADGTSQVIGHLSGPRFRESCVIVGHYLYVIGGNGPGGQCNAIEVFDLDTNAVVGTINMPLSKTLPAAVVLGTNIYIFGGLDNADNPTNTCWVLDTTSNSLTQKANMPFARAGYKGAVLFSNNMIRVQGALYNPANDTWDTEYLEPSMSSSSPIAEVVNDCVYRIGGNISGQVVKTNMCGSVQATEGDFVAAVPGSGGSQNVTCGLNGTVKVDFPAGTYTGDMLAISVLAAGPASPPGTPASKYYDISTSAGFSGLITITLPYNPATINPTIYHWNGSSWEALNTTVNSSNFTVSAQTSSLSPFFVSGGSSFGYGMNTNLLLALAMGLITAGSMLLLKRGIRRNSL